jgi:predicted phage terminase large subunit-like protein
LHSIIHRYEGTRLARQELNAEILEDIEGALWTLDLIEENRVARNETSPLKRIVVAIDPAVSVSETSDATGIIVAGINYGGHGYVLEDCSGKYSPTEWAQKAISAYRRHKADRIIAESNMGGAMVESTLRAVDRSVPVRLVHASRGKITRAEPISALYEQHRVHHVGAFPELEDEMTTYEPGSTNSPDRMDALVWALTDLMVGYDCPMTFHAPPAGISRSEIYRQAEQDIFANNGVGLPYDSGDCSCPPGGWPAGDSRAPGSSVTAGGFAHLGWSPNRRN